MAVRRARIPILWLLASSSAYRGLWEVKLYSFNRIHRLFGLCGVAGASLFFAGDMLFYGHLGSGPDFHQGMLVIVIHASRERLFAGGLVGPFAACLCIVGFWHVYRNVRPSYIALGRLMFALFALDSEGFGDQILLWAECALCRLAGSCEILLGSGL